jgi:hypothetical protein
VAYATWPFGTGATLVALEQAAKANAAAPAVRGDRSVRRIVTPLSVTENAVMNTPQ